MTLFRNYRIPRRGELLIGMIQIGRVAITYILQIQETPEEVTTELDILHLLSRKAGPEKLHHRRGPGIALIIVKLHTHEAVKTTTVHPQHHIINHCLTTTMEQLIIKIMNLTTINSSHLNRLPKTLQRHILPIWIKILTK